MKNYDKINTVVVNTAIAITMIFIVVLIFTQDGGVHQYIMEQFSNVRAEVTYKDIIDDDHTIMRLYDTDNKFEVVVYDSQYYDTYEVGDIVPMNRRTLIHLDTNTEEDVYYFLENYAH